MRKGPKGGQVAGMAESVAFSDELLWDPQEGFSECQNLKANTQTEKSYKYVYLYVHISIWCMRVCMGA